MIGLEYITKEFRIGYRELARQLGISNQTIQDWVKKRRNIPAKRLEQLSIIFKLPTEYFQKELNSIEKGEVTISYLKSISENMEVPIIEEDGEIIINHHSSSYEDEIVFLESLLETKKKQQKLKKEIDDLIKEEALITPSDKGSSSPLHTAYTNTEAIYQTIEILKNEQVADYFKVIVYLMNSDNKLGGKLESKVVLEYINFARDITKVLDKHQPEQE